MIISNSTISAKAGETVQIQATIKNLDEGCVQNYFSINAMISSEWSLQLPASAIIKAGETKTITVNATSQANITSKNYSLSLSVYNFFSSSLVTEAKANISLGSNLTCTKASPDITITPTEQTGSSQNAFGYTAFIKSNHLNCPTQQYNLTAYLPTGWTSSLLSNINLNSSEQKQINFTVAALNNEMNNSFIIPILVSDQSQAVYSQVQNLRVTINNQLGCQRAAPSISFASGVASGNTNSQISSSLTVKNNNQNCPQTTFNLSLLNLPLGWSSNLANSLSLSNSQSQIIPLSLTTAGIAGDFNISALIQDSVNTGFSQTASAQFKVIAAPVNQSKGCQSLVMVTDGDPLAPCSWHLHNTGQNGFAAAGGTDTINSEYIDINMLNFGNTYKGRGIKIAVSDSGLQLIHEDLKDNILAGASKNYDIPAPYAGDPGIDGVNGDHGTSVAGIIAAVGDNQLGSRGIASEASIAGFNYITSSQNLASTIDQANGNFDIFNQSWGLIPEQGNAVIEPQYEDQLRFGVTNLRAGKGAMYIKAAGNSFNMGVNTNMDPYNSNPFVFVISSISAQGVSSSYSQSGSANLISAPGGEFGVNQPAILTTDVMGCQSGYAKNQANPRNEFEAGGDYNPDCSYTSAFNGTSSATPMVSGAVALILEANPNLSWRDVRHILISTAKKIHSDLVDISQNLIASLPATPPGHIWEQAWKKNAAGYDYHNWYGFGALDVDAAVSMARNYTSTLMTYNESLKANGDWAFKSGNLNLNIPDNSANGVINTINMNRALKIETVQIKVNIKHEFVGDIGLELTSPSGTKSILLNVNNFFKAADDMKNMVLLSNMFHGESSLGNWTLKVIDGSDGDSGVLENWELKVNGGANGNISF